MPQPVDNVSLDVALCSGDMAKRSSVQSIHKKVLRGPPGVFVPSVRLGTI